MFWLFDPSNEKLNIENQIVNGICIWKIKEIYIRKSGIYRNTFYDKHILRVHVFKHLHIYLSNHKLIYYYNIKIKWDIFKYCTCSMHIHVYRCTIRVQKYINTIIMHIYTIIKKFSPFLLNFRSTSLDYFFFRFLKIVLKRKFIILYLTNLQQYIYF